MCSLQDSPAESQDLSHPPSPPGAIRDLLLLLLPLLGGPMASLAEAGQRRLSILRRRCDGPDAAVQRLEVGVARRCHARPRIVQRVVLHHRQLRQNRHRRASAAPPPHKQQA